MESLCLHTGKLKLFFHSISSSRPFSPTCSVMKYPLYCQFWQLFLFNFFIGITQQAYREAVWVGANISWFCWPCQPGSPVPESSRISPVSEQSIDILASSEFNPRAYQSDSSQSTIYDPPAQSTTVRWVKTRHVSLTRKGNNNFHHILWWISSWILCRYTLHLCIT